MSTNDKYEGFVAKINTKSGNGKRGPWTLYTVKVEKADGTEYPDWVRLGFDEPPIKEGDYVSFEVETDDGGVKRYVKNTLRKPKNAPARKAKQSAQNGGNGGSRGGYKGGNGGGGNRFDGTGIQNQANPKDAQRMGICASRTAAIETVALLLSANGLPLTAAKTKAGEAARFEEITAAIDKLTVRYYGDTTSDRLLETVQDEKATEAKAPDALPDQPDAEEADATSDETEAGGEVDGDDDIPY